MYGDLTIASEIERQEGETPTPVKGSFRRRTNPTKSNSFENSS